MLAINTLRKDTNIVPKMWAIGTRGKLINPIPNNIEMPEDKYFFFGILRGSGAMYKRCKEYKYDFYYSDHAYFYNDRFPKMSCFRITKNNHTNTSIYDCPSDRYNLFKKYEIKEWGSNKGEKILILPPDYYISLFENKFNWLQETIDVIKKHTDRSILIRERPVPQRFYELLPVKPKKILNVEYSSKTLEEDLNEAWCLITYNSVVSVEALIKGIPIFTNSDICATLNVAENDFSKIEEPYFHNLREKFLNSLAYCQFTLEEMRNGFAFETIEFLNKKT